MDYAQDFITRYARALVNTMQAKMKKKNKKSDLMLMRRATASV